MKLRIFLPATDRAVPGMAFPWTLFDNRGNVAREGADPVEEMPRAAAVEAVLPAERVLFARLRLPRVNAATIRELLPYAVEDRLLADPNQVHAVAGPTLASGETIVAVVDREWLRGMLAALARGGVAARSAWCESELARGERGEWHLAWGRERGMLVDDEGVAATFDVGDGVPLALRIALDESTARGDRPERLVVHGEGGAAVDCERWTADTGVPCAPGEPWEARRSLPRRRGIELLEGELAAAGAMAWRLPRQAAALALIVLVLQLVFTAVDEWRLRREYRDLDAEREAVFREAFPEARVVVDPELQMTRNVADLKRSRGLAAGDDFLVQLTHAARTSQPGAVHRVDFANGRVTLQ
jgi:general secretion pathway protein L